MKLDVARLPRHALFGTTDMADLVLRARTAVTAMSNKDLVKQTLSYGFAAAKFIDGKDSVGESPRFNWNDPYEFVWFVTGWGPDQDRYIANAVRKLRATLRTGRDTIELREKELHGKKPFKKKVDSQEEDGSFKWGDFPWGGAAQVKVGGLVIPTAVSCKLEVEDHILALFHGGQIGANLLQQIHPEEYGPQS